MPYFTTLQLITLDKHPVIYICVISLISEQILFMTYFRLLPFLLCIIKILFVAMQLH